MPKLEDLFAFFFVPCDTLILKAVGKDKQTFISL